MKKNKGFTLIELLVVIVLLVIIAIIAAPIVMKTIKVSKERDVENSVNDYIKEVDIAILKNKFQTSNTVSDGTYEINSDGNICLNSGCTETLVVEINEDQPSGGTIKITNGQVVSVDDMIIKNYKVSYTSSDNKYVVTEVYTGILCTANQTKVNASVYSSGNPSEASSYSEQQVGLLASESGAYTPGVSYTCNLGDMDRIFYVLEESGNNISLILGTSLGRKAWSEDSKNENGPVTALAYLKSNTENWTKLNESQITLPTYDQLNKVITNGTSESLSWLVSYTDKNISYGFWTSTPNTNTTYNAWSSSYISGRALSTEHVLNHNVGVRPVITLSKLQLES